MSDGEALRRAQDAWNERGLDGFLEYARAGRPAVRSALVICVAFIVLGGCGGGDSKKSAVHRETTSSASAPEPEAGGEEEERGGLEAIAAADRHAFVQIAIATGDLSTGASVLLVHGVARPQDLRTLRRLRPQIAALSPRDARLKALRRELLGALRRGIAARTGRPTATDARAILADAASIRAGLKRYSTDHPAIGAIAPD
jgi:hypothetical protein